MSKSLVILQILNVLISFSHAIYYAFVTSTGYTNNECTVSNPCGTFQAVIDNINNGTIVYENEIIITINGTNSRYAGPFDELSSYCTPRLTGNITFIFDPYFIQTLNDWFYDVEKCMMCWGKGGSNSICNMLTISENAQVKFYNLVWDMQYTMDSLKNSMFYCENCIIRYKSPLVLSANTATFLFSNKATFYKSIFDNITIGVTTSTLIGLYPWTGDHSTIEKAHDTHASLNISHCTFRNISGQNFITIESRLNYKKSVNIEYSVINTKPSSKLTRFIYVSYDLPFSNTINSINIESTSFIDNSNGDGLIVLSVEDSSECDIIMNNVNITYSQYLPIDLLDSESNTAANSVINIFSSATNIEINSMMIVTQLYCLEYEWSGSERRRQIRRLATCGGFASVPWCNSPSPFLLNEGTATLNNISLKTDYSASIWSRYFESDDEYINGGVYFARYEYYTCGNTERYQNKPYFTAILNDKNGIIDINNFDIAIGSHHSILFNRKGTANINNLYTKFFDDKSSYYNRWNLRLYKAIINYFGTLQITNSAITGSDISLINIWGGDTTIISSTLSQSMMAIITYYTAGSIYLDNVEFYEVGKYYATLGAAIYYSDSHKKTPEDLYLHQISATHLSAAVINILNCNFHYIGPNGVLKINKHGVHNVDDGSKHIREVNMMNNKMINADPFHHTTNISNIPLYNGYYYFTNFAYLESILNETYGVAVAVDNVLRFIEWVNGTARNATGVIMIDGEYELSFANNFVFIADKSVIEMENIYFYIDTEQNNCIAANKFYNIDLYVKSGNITSCKHKQVNTATSKCLHNLGPINSSFGKSYFFNSSIFIDNVLSTVIDDALFENSGNNPIQVKENRTDYNISLIFLDIILSSNTSLLFPHHCNARCHQIINHHPSEIRQLTIDCNNLTAEYSLKSLDFWSPHSVLLNDDKIDNSNGITLLYPGSTLNIVYDLVDIYGNIVDPQNVSYNLTVNLVNKDLNLYTFFTIDANGICTVCEAGVDIGITIDDVNKSFNISSIVIDNLLMSNNIYIKVIECPSGFGFSDITLRCTKCTKTTYSLVSNLQSCHICDDDIRDVQCIGANNILVEYNHWMKVITQQIDDSDYMSSRIISSDCPNSYCCQFQDGCDYLEDLKTALCALHRNSSVPLCGKCVDGYSELLGTTNCGLCNRNYYEYLILPFIIALLFSLYLLFFDRPSKAPKNNPSPSAKREKYNNKTIIMDDWRALSVMIFKILLYFCQGLVSVLLASSNINGSLTYYILPVLQIFNFSMEFGTNATDPDSGYCFLREMTASNEILLNLIIPIFILILLTISSLMRLCKLSPTLQCCCCFKNRDISYCSALLRGLLLVIGSVFAVIFKILSCREIDDGIVVHYYYGSDECHDALWWLSLFGLIFILSVWLIFDIILFKMKKKRQQQLDNNLYILVKAYEPNYWYWETILLSRRTFLALFTVIHLNNVLIILLCIYFGLQTWKQPFKYKRVNRLESVCILVLIIISVFVNVNSDLFDMHQSVLFGLFLLICVLLPILIVLYECCQVVKHWTVSTDKISKRIIDKIEMRRPTNTPIEINNYDSMDDEEQELEVLYAKTSAAKSLSTKL